ncbi:hypothetical protein ACERIT_15280 (plasmid) [Halopenitus sp. H-Gu1]|uniref:hypothetical protein n=1 Tax=Halopenitus sp. H-Gu1 TaxID=3242697 RepID=UPI00359EF659
MADDSTPDRFAFGEMYPIARGRFGQVTGGARGGGFHWLLDEADHDRGFLSESDRRLLLETVNLDFSDPSQRNARRRMRNRVLTTYLDSRYLRYIDDRDREIIFENARDEGYDLHFREGFKEFVRFTYLGLLEDDFDIDIPRILEAAIQEAEQEHAVAAAENISVQVDIDVTRTDEDSVEELERRFHQRDKLTRHELAVLVNSQHENAEENVEDAADIDLADALYYHARQPDSDPHGYSWQDPDREEAEEIVEWLRSVFEEYDIETYDDLEVGMERLSLADEELGGELKEKLNHLSRVAPNFEAQLALEADLSERDMAFLHHILYNPDNLDVETVLEEEARPPTAGEDWNPAEDEYLQKFIARVEADGSPAGGEEGRERWNEVLRLAEFDEDEWSEYMEEQHVETCVTELKEWVEADDLDTDLIHEAESWEDYWQSLPQSQAQHFHLLVSDYGEVTMDAALESLASELDSE